MAKGTKLSEFEKGYIIALKKSENFREKFIKKVKPFSAILEKSTYVRKKKIHQSARKIIISIQENNCL